MLVCVVLELLAISLADKNSRPIGYYSIYSIVEVLQVLVLCVVRTNRQSDQLQATK